MKKLSDEITKHAITFGVLCFIKGYHSANMMKIPDHFVVEASERVQRGYCLGIDEIPQNGLSLKITEEIMKEAERIYTESKENT